MKKRLWTLTAIAIAGALGVATSAAVAATSTGDGSSDETPAPIVQTPVPETQVTAAPEPADGTAPDTAALVAVTADVIPAAGLPDGLHFIEELSQPGSDMIHRVYATDSYVLSRTDPNIDIGPVVVVAARPLANNGANRAPSTDFQSEALPEIAPEAELLTAPESGPIIEVDDGATLVQFVGTNYSAEQLVGFVESIVP